MCSLTISSFRSNIFSKILGFWPSKLCRIAAAEEDDEEEEEAEDDVEPAAAQIPLENLNIEQASST